MHIYFSGIGGSAISSFALLARDMGYEVSGSDKQDSATLAALRAKGITDIHIGQDEAAIAALHTAHPIDWFVYSDAVTIEQPDSPELRFCAEHGIQATKRAGFINHILAEKNLQLIAIAGTHGKSTTTGMAIWALQQLGEPVSYVLGAKIPFGASGHYEPGSRYFVYEADEFARHFLDLQPTLTLISGIDYDHPDIYPTREDYNQAFRQFLAQSGHAFIWQADAERLGIAASDSVTVLQPEPDTPITLPGAVNRQNGALVAQGVASLLGTEPAAVYPVINNFPGVHRRFERLANGLYSDYAHTVPKIQGALQIAEEIAPGRVVVVYEGLHNTRQHFIKNELPHLFDSTKALYIVPSYLAREDPNLALLTPEDLRALLSPENQTKTTPSALDDALLSAIKDHLAAGDLVLALTAGGGGSLDEWLRARFL